MDTPTKRPSDDIRQWHCVFSTVSLGRRYQHRGEFVCAVDEEQALERAERMGLTRVVGLKFEGVVAV